MTGGGPARRRRGAAARSAWSLLTVLGRGAPVDRAAPAWFGPVGLVVGALTGAAWWLAGEASTPFVAAAIAVAVDAALTGMLHLDGLADCGDGLVAPMDPRRRLEVMRRPDVGAFGVVVVVVALLLRTAALTAVAPSPLLLAGVWAAGRAAMAATAAVLPYARPEGLATAFADPAANRAGALAGAAVGAAALAGWAATTTGPRPGAAAVAASAGLVLGAVLVAAIARRRLGGYTGDVLGAVVVVAETTALLGVVLSVG